MQQHPPLARGFPGIYPPAELPAVCWWVVRTRDARGLAENKVAARKGGGIAGEAREKLEQETGEGVVTAGNYLDGPEGWKRLEDQKQE